VGRAWVRLMGGGWELFIFGGWLCCETWLSFFSVWGLQGGGFLGVLIEMGEWGGWLFREGGVIGVGFCLRYCRWFAVLRNICVKSRCFVGLEV